MRQLLCIAAFMTLTGCQQCVAPLSSPEKGLSVEHLAVVAGTADEAYSDGTPSRYFALSLTNRRSSPVQVRIDKSPTGASIFQPNAWIEASPNKMTWDGSAFWIHADFAGPSSTISIAPGQSQRVLVPVPPDLSLQMKKTQYFEARYLRVCLRVENEHICSQAFDPPKPTQ